MPDLSQNNTTNLPSSSQPTRGCPPRFPPTSSRSLSRHRRSDKAARTRHLLLAVLLVLLGGAAAMVAVFFFTGAKERSGHARRSIYSSSPDRRAPTSRSGVPAPPPTRAEATGSTSGGVTQGFALTILPASTVTSVSSSHSVAKQHSPVPLVATVSSGVVPTGVVSFTNNGVVLPGCQNLLLSTKPPYQAKCTVVYGQTGTHIIVAVYDGTLRTNPSKSSPYLLHTR